MLWEVNIGLLKLLKDYGLPNNAVDTINKLVDKGILNLEQIEYILEQNGITSFDKMEKFFNRPMIYEWFIEISKELD